MQAYYVDDKDTMAYSNRNRRGQFQQRRGIVRRAIGGTASLLMTLIKLAGFFSILLGFLVAFMIFFPEHQVTLWVMDKIKEYDVPIPEDVKDKVLPTTTPAPRSMTSVFLDFLVDALTVLAVLAAFSFLLFAVHENVIYEEENKMYFGFELALLVIAAAAVIMTKNNSSIGKWLLLAALVLSVAAIARLFVIGKTEGLNVKVGGQNTAIAMGILAMVIVFFRAITGFVTNFVLTIVPSIRIAFWSFVILVAGYMMYFLFEHLGEDLKLRRDGL